MKTIFSEEIIEEKLVSKCAANVITIEGLDGSGKTTLINNCIDKLSDEGYKVKYFQTSSGFNVFWKTVNTYCKNGFITNDINQIFHNISFLTYLKTIFTDDLMNYDYVLTDWYIYGKMVLSELYSNDIDSVSKRILEEELKHNKIILPDYSFYIDLSPEIAFDRIAKRKNIPETKESLKMLMNAYILWEKYVDFYDIERLNGNLSSEELSNIVVDNILDKNVLKYMKRK